MSLKPKVFLGMGKTIANANICELKLDQDGEYSWEVLILERWLRQKWSGRWPLELLEEVKAFQKEYEGIGDNRDITTPQFIETLYEKKSLFYELLKKKDLDNFVSHFNQDLITLPHHMAHAYSAVTLMPYEEALILVIDGGGTKGEDYAQMATSEFETWPSELPLEPQEIEHISLYWWKEGKLLGVYKKGLVYREVEGVPHKLSDGLGSAYEKCATLIFNDSFSSGKVMGLAAFGTSFYKGEDLFNLQKSLPWDCTFEGGGKEKWQNSPHLKTWQDCAATIQEAFEKELLSLVGDIKERRGPFKDLPKKSIPLVYSGGCALNCTANWKVHQVWKDGLYIVPNPGDESVGLGLAMALATQRGGLQVKPRQLNIQHSAFGKRHERGQEFFDKLNDEFDVKKTEDLSEIARLLKAGEIIAWFYGRSECGPRALGHRSLLARVDRPGLKDHLNRTIKFREDFRPYGASILWEEAHQYFEIEECMQNPFMTYATPIREEKRELLKEVMHEDGTCRMQTVMKEQNPKYYELLQACQKLGLAPLLLNTSLNIMGEPIVETPEDALHFLRNSQARYLVLEDYLIKKKEGIS